MWQWHDPSKNPLQNCGCHIWLVSNGENLNTLSSGCWAAGINKEGGRKEGSEMPAELRKKCGAAPSPLQDGCSDAPVKDSFHSISLLPLSFTSVFFFCKFDLKWAVRSTKLLKKLCIEWICHSLWLGVNMTYQHCTTFSSHIYSLFGSWNHLTNMLLQPDFLDLFHLISSS